MRIDLLIGIVLFIAGFVGFGIDGNRQRHLLHTGRHATATVVRVAPYGGTLASRNSFGRAHVDVQFSDEAGQLVIARLGIGDYAHYTLGQRVQIVYDPVNPSQAVFAHGYTDIGPVGFVFLAGIFIGFALAFFALRRLSMWRRAAKALQGSSTLMTATSRYLRTSRYQGWAIALEDGSGRKTQFWSATRSGCPLLQQPTPVIVFGRAEPRAVIVAVDPVGTTAVAGRIPRRWRATDPIARRAASDQHLR
jgi:hypothetical protein